MSSFNMFLLIFLLGHIALIAATEASVPIVEIDERNKLNSVTGASIDLDLSGLGLKSIHQNAFDNCTITKTLNLSDNSIGELPKNVFAPLVNLEHLSLANNVVKSTRNAFLGLNQLKTLNISNNPLKAVLNGHNFAGLTKSCDIFVSGSKRLQYLTPMAFGKKKRNIGIKVNDQPKITCPERVETQLHELRNNLIVLESAIPLSISVKACMQQHTVKSIETYGASETLPESCRRTRFEENSPRIDFYESSIESFEKGWYQIQNPSFNTIHLVFNWIREINSELLNDLPQNIKSVNLERNNIERVKKNVIVNYHLQALDLSENGLRVIEEDAFANTNLTHLNLQNNMLTSLSFATSLPNTLIHLALDSNEITEIPANTFANLKNLLRVTFSGNRINELQPQCFKGLESLQVLTLSSVEMERIQIGVFQDLKSLRSLDFFDNKISRLERGVFEGLGCLDFLDLSSNKLTTLSKESLEGLTENLNTLSLWSNELEKLEADTFVNKPRTSLSLEFNRIQEIVEGTFDLPHLKDLFLNNNNISRIEKGAVRHLGDSRVYLSGNPIKRLENGALAGLMSKASVDLGKNNNIEVIQGGVFDDV